MQRANAWAPVLAAAVIVAAYLYFGLHAGVPGVRHDWAMPVTAAGWKAFAWSLTSGWTVNGIGSPNPYPTLFVLGPILAIIGIIAGSATAVGSFLGAIALMQIVAGARIGRLLAGNAWLGFALALFMLYNPWSYEEMVAGHLTMLLSLGACALLAAELFSERPRRWVIILCAYVAAFQIQFAILAVPFAAMIRFDLRSVGLTFAGSVLSLLPSIVGITLSHTSLYAVPFSVEWQYNNSVRPLGALFLDGYFAHYTAGSETVFRWGMVIIVAAAVIGLLAGLRSRLSRARSIRMAIGAGILVCYATGLRWVFSGVYTLSLNVRQTLVFRELFDLLGIVALVYGLFAVFSAARYRWAAVVFFAGALLLFGAWWMAPPYRWWVPAYSVPQVAIDTSRPNERFALMPWRQPLRFEGKGSGADPDDFARANNVTPLNEYENQFPSDVALESYAHKGDARGLEALSVARVYPRAYFESNERAIRTALPAARSHPGELGTRVLRPMPELSLVAIPPVRYTLAPFSDTYLFYGGDPLEIARDIETVAPPHSTTDPRFDWVAIPFVATRYPAVANAYGGAFTVSSSARLPVPSRSPAQALAFVHGRLLSDAGTVSESTGGWHWIPLRGATWLRCQGACGVVAWQRRHSAGAKTGQFRAPALPDETVDFKQITPFLVAGKLPDDSRGGSRLLLYRTRFDPAWVLLGIPYTRHVQVSTVFNGYELRRIGPGEHFLLVEVTAALQAGAMLLSLLGLLLFTLPLKRGIFLHPRTHQQLGDIRA